MSDYDPLGLNSSGGYDPLGLDSGGDYDPLGLNNKRQKDAEYNPWRSGLVGFVESATGLGDEADALVRRLSSNSGLTYDQALDQSRAELDAFKEENPYASGAITVAGMAGAFLIPGAGAMRIAQTGSKLARAGKMAGLAGAEGAAYGYASGRDEERLETAAVGAAAGGVLGGLMGRFLTKNADELARIDAEDAALAGKGTHIGGDDGFVSVGKAKEPSGRRSSVEDSTQQREVTDIDWNKSPDDPLDPTRNQAGDLLSAAGLGTREWIDKNVGKRAGRLVEDSELLIRNNKREIDDLFDNTMKPAFDALENNKMLKSILSQVGSKSAQKLDVDDTGKYLRVDWNDVKSRVKSPEEARLVDELREQVDELKLADFAIEGVEDGADYFPRIFTGAKTASKTKSVDDYANPVMALKEMAEDISSARVVAQRFGLDISDITVPKGASRLDTVIREVEKRAVKEGASESVAANLGNGLRTTLVASKQGGDAAGAIARKLTSSALLATPFNAILNISEGITAPIYQNGVKAWAASVPQALKSTLSSKLGIEDQKWLSNHELGLDKQFMGELSATAEKESRKWADSVSKFLYNTTGVSTVNRVSQELLSNSAVKRGMELAKKGNIDKLAKHDGARGLNNRELTQLAAALKNGDVQNPLVKNFAAVSMNKWQPVSASSMPKAFNDHPNGRVFYSMLSYMNRQMNAMREDIGMNLYNVQKYGLNSDRGADSLKQAMKASAKYSALFGMFAGVWDDARKTIDFSNDKELEDLFTPDGMTKAMLNQMASNVSSGVVNIRAEEYGGKTVEPIPAPISAGMQGLSAAASLATGDVDPALRFGQTYVPGVSQLDKMSRMGMFSPQETAEDLMKGVAPTGSRLFEGLLE